MKEQDFHPNMKENVNPILNLSVAIKNKNQISLKQMNLNGIKNSHCKNVINFSLNNSFKK